MATKPVDNIPEWADASNAGNYTGGPFAGQPRKVSIPAGIAAEGFRPGADDPSAAEHVNDYLNMASLLLRWVYAGTAAGVAEATIVERSSTGRITAQSGVFDSDLVANSHTLSCTAPVGTGSALLVYAAAPGGNVDVLCEMVHENDGQGIMFLGGAFCVADCAGDNIKGLTIDMLGTTGADGIVVTTDGLGCDGVRSIASGQASYALYGQVDNATAIAVQGLAVDDGIGGRFYGGGSSGVGCLVEGTADDGLVATGGSSPTEAAVRGTGKLDACGGIFQGGPSGGIGLQANGTGSSPGLFATGANLGGYCETTSNTGYGLYCTSSAGSTTGAALYCFGQNAGDGILATAVDGNAGDFATSGSGNAVSARTSSTGNAGNFVTTSTGHAGVFTCSGDANAARFDAAGTKATTVHVPRAADPSSHEDGGMYYLDNVGMSVRREGATRRLYDTAGGMAYASAWATSGTADDNSNNVILTLTFAGANIPVATGKVLIRVGVEVGRNSGTPDCKFEILDVTAGPIIAGSGDTIKLHQAAGATAYERHLGFELPYDLPAAGARTFTVRLYSTVPGEDINWRNAGASVVGVF